VREREDANRTRVAGHLDEIQGVVAITLNVFRNGAVGFIDWLDRLTSIPSCAYRRCALAVIDDAPMPRNFLQVEDHNFVVGISCNDMHLIRPLAARPADGDDSVTPRVGNEPDDLLELCAWELLCTWRHVSMR